jgi:PAS domain S-box-containing protein
MPVPGNAASIGDRIFLVRNRLSLKTNLQGAVMSTPDFRSEDQRRQLRTILIDLQDQIRNLPEVYRPSLESRLDRLSSTLGDDLPAAQAHTGSPPAELPEQPAYLLGRDLPISLLKQMEFILDNLDSAIFVFDRQGIIRRANHRAITLLGFDPRGMSHEQFFSYFQLLADGQPISMEQCPVFRAEHGETVDRIPLELRLHKSNPTTCISANGETPFGRTYSILVSAVPVRVENTFTGVVSVWNDVTELERLTGQFEAERDQLKTILESISDEVWYSDQDLNIRLMNESAGSNLGIERPEHINQDPIAAMLEVIEIYYPDGTPRPNDETPLLRSLHGEVTRGQEIVRNKRSGRVMFREYTSAPIRFRDQITGAVSVVRDITHQQRQEQFLRESELRERARAAELYAVMNAVPAVIFVTHDSQARLVTGNLMAHRLLRVEQGFNFSRVGETGYVTRPYRVFHDGRELGVEEMPLERCAATGQPVRDFMEDILFNDGSQIHLVGNITPLFDETGQPAGAVGAYVDVTERVNAERALRESEERLRSVLENSRDIIYRYNLQTKHYDIVSPVIEQILGWSLDDAREVTFDRVLNRIHPDDRTSMQATLHNAAAVGKGMLEFRFQRKDGQYRWLSDHLTVMKDVDGIALFSIGTIRDITEQKENEANLHNAAEQQRENERVLREANERFRVALASAPITVFTMDCDLRYTWIYSLRYGLNSLPMIPDEQALGKRDDELFLPEDVEELMELKWSVISTGKPVQQEVMVRMNAEWFTYVITLDPLLNADGQVAGLTGSALDITLQHRLEVEYLEQVTQVEIQRRLLESREQERQEVARDLHDGPIQLLSATLFNLQMNKEAIENAQLRTEFEQIAENVRNAVKELRAMVNELRPPAIIRFGLAKAIHAHAEDFSGKHPELTLELELAEDQTRLPEQICLNLFRIYQEALNNIVRHAEASHAWVRFTLDPSQIVLEIQDDGQGFSVPANLVDRTLNGHYGLIGMSERCEAIGGKLEILSHPGQGAQLRAIVPGQFSE